MAVALCLRVQIKTKEEARCMLLLCMILPDNSEALTYHGLLLRR
jgi:hypothetical protein